MFLYSENGLTLLVERIRLGCYIWIVYVTGNTSQVIDFDTTTGKHADQDAFISGFTAMDNYRREAVPVSTHRPAV